jgi:hypothetical protein
MAAGGLAGVLVVVTLAVPVWRATRSTPRPLHRPGNIGGQPPASTCLVSSQAVR